jgi:hypothetical protein
MAATPPITSGGSPEDNLDKMIKQQERMFSLEVKKDTAKSEHDMKMGLASTMGRAAEKV